MTRIAEVHAREILDSRGQPTIEVEMRTAGPALGRAMVPAGASTGKAEVCELRDGESNRYEGRGVRRAVAHINEVVGPAMIGLDAADQVAVDERLLELDPTPRKTRRGGNTLLGVSLAAPHAAAAARGVPLYEHLHALFCRGPSSFASYAIQQAPALPVRLPLPMTNMISGGLHAGGNLDFQDFLIVPRGAPDYPTALEWIVRVYRQLGRLLAAAGYEGRLVGDEGGFGPRLKSNREAAEFVVRAIAAARLVPGKDVTLAVDVAASHFFAGTHYRLAATGKEQLSSEQMIEHIAALADEFPIESIEDGLAEDDWQGWQKLTSRLGNRLRLVGDDLFTTNCERLRRGIDQHAANSILIKFNQIGTLSETLDTIHLARSAGYGVIVSARSGETEDTTMADLAVAVAADHIKIGSIVRSERLAKYNRLLTIAEHCPENWHDA